jgi:hypothetical protein
VYLEKQQFTSAMQCFFPGMPRLDPRIFKQPYVASGLGETAVISVPVLADPVPSFLWYKIRDGVPSIILQGSNESLGHSDKSV